MKTTCALKAVLNPNPNLNLPVPSSRIKIKSKIKIKKRLAVAATLASLCRASFAAEVSLESAPPVIVRTEPVAGATRVDPHTSEIVVQFSKKMQDGSWSWSTWGEENFPEMVGQPKYLADGRTCVLKVKLQPGKFYATWLNSDKFKNFKDTAGRPAVPYLLTFRTAASGSGSTAAANRKFVRLVVSREQMTFEGAPTTRDQLESLLAKVTDRAHTVLELAATADSLTAKEYLDVQAIAGELVKQLGFEYLSLVGVQSLGSKGNQSPNPRAATSPASDAKDALLNDDQRAVLAWTDRQFRSFFDARTFDGWSDEERTTLERKLIDALNGPRSTEYYQAINTLAAMRSTKALPRLREIATERVDRNNRDRWMAIRALGLIGDKESVPELIHLVYHGNVNTRWWAQISLVRITGQNFAKDWNAWGKWWNNQNGQPPFKTEIIRWWNGQAEPEKLAESLDESDHKFLESLKPKSAAAPAPATSSEVATRLRNATPLMDGIRESWSSAVESMQREDATSALASLRILAPRIQEFVTLMKGTALEAGAAEALETLRSLMKSLEKGDKDATQSALAAMTALGQKMEAQVKTFTDTPSVPAAKPAVSAETTRSD